MAPRKSKSAAAAAAEPPATAVPAVVDLTGEDLAEDEIEIGRAHV